MANLKNVILVYSRNRDGEKIFLEHIITGKGRYQIRTNT